MPFGQPVRLNGRTYGIPRSGGYSRRSTDMNVWVAPLSHGTPPDLRSCEEGARKQRCGIFACLLVTVVEALDRSCSRRQWHGRDRGYAERWRARRTTETLARA